jgi:hypothetical protein
VQGGTGQAELPQHEAEEVAALASRCKDNSTADFDLFQHTQEVCEIDLFDFGWDEQELFLKLVSSFEAFVGIPRSERQRMTR